MAFLGIPNSRTNVNLLPSRTPLYREISSRGYSWPELPKDYKLWWHHSDLIQHLRPGTCDNDINPTSPTYMRYRDLMTLLENAEKDWKIAQIALDFDVDTDEAFKAVGRL